jgi:predicted porin
MDAGVGSTAEKVNGTEVTTVRTGGNSAGALSSNRLGFRGNEKIGSMTAGFHYELGMDAGGTGDLATTGGVRKSTVSLAGGFGSLEIGRDYTPVFLTALKYDASMADNVQIGKTVYLNTAGDQRITTVRNSGQITYATPNMGGLQGKLAWTRSEKDPGAGGDYAAVGGSISYDAGPISLQVGFGHQENRQADLLIHKRDETVVGASYTVSKEIKLMGMWGKLEQDLPTKSAGTRKAEYDAYQLGIHWNVAPAMLLHASYGKGDTKSVLTNTSTITRVNSDLTGYKLGFIYSLSKRTRTYALLGIDELDTKAATNTTRDRSEFAIGINHSF